MTLRARLLFIMGLSGFVVFSEAGYVTPVQAVSVNVRDRASVIAAYNAEFNRVEPGSAWNGNVDACQSGTTSTAYQLSVLQRVNWYRDMAGLPAVAYNTAFNQSAQDGALISSAEGQLSHTPANTTKCYTQSGYTGTSSSNLFLGRAGISAVDGYIDDFGDNNTVVGHRSWLLYRSLGPIATGDIETDGTHYSANAIYVTGGGGTPATPRDGFISWPPSGYVPDAVLYDRWSFSLAGRSASFQNANVTITGPNGSIPVTVNDRSGFLDTGVVFTPAIPSNKVTTDTTYTVNITGITGGTTSSYTYQVTVIHVNQAPREASHSAWGAATCVTPLSKIFQVNLSDPDGDSSSYHLVNGYGDTDNSLFQVTSDGVIQNIAELDTGKTKYHLRYEAVDSNGWSMQKTLLVNLKDPVTDTTIVCPGRKLTLSPTSNGGTHVEWNIPVAGSASSWNVSFTPSDAWCQVTTTSCDVTTLKNGTTYKVDLYAVRGSWSVPYTVYFTKTASNSGSSTTPVRTFVWSSKTITAGSKLKLSKIVVVKVKGTSSYRATGACSLRKGVMSFNRVGKCRVAVSVKLKNSTKVLRSSKVFTVKAKSLPSRK